LSWAKTKPCDEEREASSLAIVLRHAPARGAQNPQVERLSFTLVSCQSKEESSLAIVLQDAPALFVAYPETLLRYQMPLLGRTAVEASSLVVILRHPHP